MHQKILMLLMLALTPTAHGGVGAHGGEIYGDDDNVWNLVAKDEAVKPIGYCILRGEKAPPLAELEGMVKDSLTEWRAFFAKYKLDQKVFPQLFADGKERRMLLDFEYLPAGCTEPKKQVAILFGTNGHELLQSDPFLLEGKLGLAKVYKPYDHQTYRNGGVIWLAPWTYKTWRLKSMLLHELGHLFGMPHDSVAIMSQFLAEQITKAADGLPQTIETPSWKYRLNVGDVLDFGSSDRAKILGCPAGSTPVQLIREYREFLALFRLPDDACYRTQLQYLGLTKDRPCMEEGQACNGFRFIVYKWNGQIYEEAGHLDGVFSMTGLAWRPEVSGPSIYTAWKTTSHFAARIGKLSAPGRVYLEQDVSPPPVPARGYFYLDVPAPAGAAPQAGTEIRWAAELDQNPDPRLEIFFPKDGLWLREHNVDNMPPLARPSL